MNLDEFWKHLEEDFSGGPGAERIQRRIAPGNPRNFLLGLEIPSRNRMLILRVQPDSMPDAVDFPESRGMRTSTRILNTEIPTAEIELVLKDGLHKDIFDRLIDDLVIAANEPESELAGVGKFLSRLTEWQRLFMRLASDELSRESQQGLWGELWTLREIVSPVVGLNGAVEAWRGPLGADQDFQLGAFALEVKTSTSTSVDHVMIASEQQLDVVDGIELALIVLSLDARPNYGETLPALVSELRRVSKEEGCLEIFEIRVAQSGYKDEHENSYEAVGYSIRSRFQFLVGEEFPRIRVRDLKPGVGNVAYSVALTACENHVMTEQELNSLVGGGNDN
jgi:hypothetical protein